MLRRKTTTRDLIWRLRVRYLASSACILQRRHRRDIMSLQVPALHDALQLLDVGGNPAVCVAADRVLARMLKWPRMQSDPSENCRSDPIIPVLHDDTRSASLGMFAPLPDQVILNIFERLQSSDLHKYVLNHSNLSYLFCRSIRLNQNELNVPQAHASVERLPHLFLHRVALGKHHFSWCAFQPLSLCSFASLLDFFL